MSDNENVKIGGSSQEREIDNLLSRDDWIDIFEI